MNYIYTNEPIEQAALAAVGILREHLSKGERILWLLAGGSGLEVAAIASKSKRLKNIDLSNLYVSMTDERYGPIGHKDENWQQLLDLGFKLPNANLYRPLIGQNIDNTTTAFNNWLETQFATADFKLGVFGIGIDGHTAGIMPHSSATEAIELATSFTSKDFKRITISFIAIEQLDEAVIQATGAEKELIVRELAYDGFPIDERPVQILKKIPLTSLYTDISKVAV
jgi:6-phosphogluconolactonase/glucosamine-6-phosphate isomerase/deaminase